MPIEEDTESNQISVDKDPEKNKPPIEEEKEIHKNDENCPTRYWNKWYSLCPEDACITQDDLELKNCIPLTLETKVFNDICFNNLETITNNIKSLSDNNQIFSTESGIIIMGYSIKNKNNNIESNEKYSIVYLGECETKIREYYNLSEQ